MDISLVCAIIYLIAGVGAHKLLRAADFSIGCVFDVVCWPMGLVVFAFK